MELNEIAYPISHWDYANRMQIWSWWYSGTGLLFPFSSRLKSWIGFVSEWKERDCKMARVAINYMGQELRNVLEIV